MANRSDRRFPNLLGCKAREADGLMSGRRADFHHGPEHNEVPLIGRIHACNRISDHQSDNLAHGLGPYMMGWTRPPQLKTAGDAGYGV